MELFLLAPRYLCPCGFLTVQVAVALGVVSSLYSLQVLSMVIFVELSYRMLVHMRIVCIEMAYLRTVHIFLAVSPSMSGNAPLLFDPQVQFNEYDNYLPLPGQSESQQKMNHKRRLFQHLPLSVIERPTHCALFLVFSSSTDGWSIQEKP